MWLILQQENPDDFVIGTSWLHTLQDLGETAYRSVARDWRENVVSDSALIRPLEFGQMLADLSKARKQLGGKLTVSFDKMVKKTVSVQVLRLKTLAHSAN